MTGPVVLTVAPEIASIVAPVAVDLPHVRVVDRDMALDAPLARAAAALRAASGPPPLTAAVRAMYKRVGLDPTKTRPSSEALLRRVSKGDPLPRVNSLVDVINWTSVETQLPFGLYDRECIVGAVTLRLGAAGESYSGIRKDQVRLEGRLTLADERGPFGNPTSDSARTMVTTSTRSAWAVIFVPAGAGSAAGDAAAALTRERVAAFCAPSP